MTHMHWLLTILLVTTRVVQLVFSYTKKKEVYIISSS